MADLTPLSLDPDDYEDVEIDDPDNPELTEGDFARARPFREVLPELYAQVIAEKGVTLALPADVVQAFSEQGADWADRMVAVLTEAARRKAA